MPDKFVPFDSTQNTAYFNNLITSRAMREVTLSYFLNHQQELEAMTLEHYINNFNVSKEIMTELYARGDEFNVEYNEEEFLLAKNHIMAFIKAEIARSIWDEDGFYPIYNAISNESFAQALTMFDEAQALVEVRR